MVGKDQRHTMKEIERRYVVRERTSRFANYSRDAGLEWLNLSKPGSRSSGKRHTADPVAEWAANRLS